jgi:2,4-dienoyl-CoA reductase-like NADH-dependent reductase (Old Yellow Enzyme family)
MTDQCDERTKTLGDEAGSGAQKIADEVHDDGKAALVELHQIGRRAGAKLKDGEKKIERTLKLVD